MASHQLQRPLSEEEANHVLQERDYDYDKNEMMKDTSHGHKKNSSHGQKKPAGVAPQKLQLSREQMKEVFREHDMDGDGCLSVGELMKAFGFMGSIIPFYKAHYGLAQADADGDGLISEDELDKLIDYAEKTMRKK